MASTQDTPPPTDDLSLVERRERRRRKLVCQSCGTGRLPESRYCLQCGAELPEVPHEELPEIAELKRPSKRAVLWFGDLLPGIFSLKLLAQSCALFVVAVVSGVISKRTFSTMAGWGGFQAVFYLPLATFLGGGAVLLWLTGLSWLLYGHVTNLVEAFSDFRTRHWFTLLILTVLALRIFFWIF